MVEYKYLKISNNKEPDIIFFDSRIVLTNFGDFVTEQGVFIIYDDINNSIKGGKKY